MISLEDSIQTELIRLRQITDTDFAALALTDGEQMIRWRFASGNRNGRYRRIVLRLGKGIAGKVISSGRPMLINNFSPTSGDDPREYPIMLAENLQSALGVPVQVQGRVTGVLLIGFRLPLGVSPSALEFTAQAALNIGEIIAEQRS